MPPTKREKDFPLWQAPFRALFGMMAGILVLIIPALAIFGFLLSLSVVLVFFGARHDVWPRGR